MPSILKIALIGAFISSPFAGAATAGETMTKDQISSQIIGTPLATSRKGMPVRLTYNQDGSVTMKALIMSATGTWRYAENGLCMTMTKGPRKGETCVTFVDLGNGEYLNSEGMTLTAK